MDLRNRKNQTIIALLIIAGILLFKSCSDNRGLKEQVALYETAQDSLTQTRNDLGQQITSTSLMKAAKKKDFLKMQTNDSTILALQKVVKDYKGKLASATVLGSSTSDSGTSVTTTSWDTIKTDTGSIIHPVFKTDWDERWSRGNIIASKDSISRNIQVKNEFEFTQGLERQGFLKKRKSLVTIKNLNPNTVTTELKTFTVQAQKKRFSVGIGAAYGLDITNLKMTIVIGPTIHMPLISW